MFHHILATICLKWVTVRSSYCIHYYHQHSLTVILMYAIANTTNECNVTVCFWYYRDRHACLTNIDLLQNNLNITLTYIHYSSDCYLNPQREREKETRAWIQISLPVAHTRIILCSRTGELRLRWRFNLSRLIKQDPPVHASAVYTQTVSAFVCANVRKHSTRKNPVWVGG